MPIVGDVTVEAADNIGYGFWTHQFQGAATWYHWADRRMAVAGALTYEANGKKEDFDLTPGDIVTLNWGVDQYLPVRSNENLLLDLGIAGYSSWQVGDRLRHCGRDRVGEGRGSCRWSTVRPDPRAEECDADVSLFLRVRIRRSLPGAIDRAQFCNQVVIARDTTMNRLSSLTALLALVFASLAAGGARSAEPAKANAAPAGSVDTRIGALHFVRGFPTEETTKKLFDEMDFQRAVQAFLWSFPAVSFESIRVGVKRDMGVDYNEMVIADNFLDANGVWLTANDTTIYGLVNVDLSQGPVVVDVPAGPAWA